MRNLLLHVSEPVEQELDRFTDMIKQSEELSQFVTSPLHSLQEQGKVISALLAMAEISGLTGNFLSLVTANRRLGAVRDMITAYAKLASSHRGETMADVTTATQLSPTQMDALKEALNDAMGRDVQVNTSIEPEILGGMIVKVGSRMIDNSLRTKLSNLENVMKEVG